MKPFLWLPLAAFLLGVMLAGPVSPCTTFVMGEGRSSLFGRSYDFEFGEALVVVNPRRLAKASRIDAAAMQSPARWVSHYGSVTFNQYGVGQPTGGVNEAGLVVELLWLDAARYPAADGRPAVGTLEFIQYLLDTAGSLDEAMRAAGRVRIAGRTPLHFLLADASGRSAAIDFVDGALVVHGGDGPPVRALANDRYVDAVARLRGYAGFGGTQALPQDNGSLSRFARAADGVRLAGARGEVPRAFELLDEVAQPGATHWQIVYELARGVLHYRTASRRALRRIDLREIDFACAAGLRLLDIDEGEGDMSRAFHPYSRAVNEAQLRTAYARTSFLRHLPPEAAQRDAAAPDDMHCVAADPTT